MIGVERPILLILLVSVLPLLYLGYGKSRFKKIIIFTKIVTVSLLVLAAASPFMETEQQLSEEPEVTLLVDESSSASLIKNSDMEFEGVKTTQKTIASGNSSDLKSGILRNLEQNKAYLVVSDLQADENLEPVTEKARQKNASINILKPEFDEATSVTIKGPDKTVPGAENRFTVKTYSTGENVEPELYLDGEVVELQKQSNSTYSFSKKFEKQGRHSIKAEISSGGNLAQTDSFYSTVKVSEKPELLVVGEKGAFEDHLSDFYSLDYQSSIPEDLSDYYAVIVKESFQEEQVANYVAEGNGLIYTGDFEEERNILPVTASDKEDQSEGAEIMMVIDISKTTEDSISEQQKLAYSLAETLPYNNRVGAVAYNEEAYRLSKPKPLASYRDRLQQQISRLEPEGNTFHHVGLEAGIQALEEDSNIILITDGKLSNFGKKVNTREKSLRLAREFDGRIITLGVDVPDQGSNEARNFLEDLADAGNGVYLDADQSGRLNFMFEAGGADEGAGRLVKVNNHHFITQGLSRLDTRTSGYDSVAPKKGADLLVTSETGQPFLTGWRYGLGRVAAFSGGSPDLATTGSKDPELVTRTASWAAGQPDRKQDRWINIKDGRKPGKVKVEASYQANGLSRKGENLYSTDINVNRTGFHQFQGETFGYSYNKELERIGYKEENEFLATRTGGKIFAPDEKEEIKESLQNYSDREVKNKKPVSKYLILLAMVVFLSEVGYRKRKGKK